MGSRFVEQLDTDYEPHHHGGINTSRGESSSTSRDEKSSTSGRRSMFANAASATGMSLPISLFSTPNTISLCARSTDVRCIDKEHRMTLKEGIHLYPKAIFWSMLISSLCAMEGYDVSLIGNFYAFPPFNQQFGELQPGGNDYQVPARWQTGLSCGAQGGQIIGLISELQVPRLTLT